MRKSFCQWKNYILLQIKITIITAKHTQLCFDAFWTQPVVTLDKSIIMFCTNISWFMNAISIQKLNKLFYYFSGFNNITIRQSIIDQCRIKFFGTISESYRSDDFSICIFPLEDYSKVEILCKHTDTSKIVLFISGFFIAQNETTSFL